MSDRQSTNHALTLIRLSLVIVAFVLGHDLLMAMDAHAQDADSSHHTVAIQQCGVEDGNLHATSMLPTPAAPDVVHVMPWHGWMNEHGSIQEPILQDVSTSRAFLQVFLN